MALTEPQAGPQEGVAPEMGMDSPDAPPAAPEPPQAMPDALFDVTVVRKREYGCARVVPVPPEEFGISRKAKLADGVNAADYCFHETDKSAHELIVQGFDAEQVKNLPIGNALEDSTERQARDTVNETDETDGVGNNWVTRRHKVTEHYARLDYEGDGKPRLYRITTAGSSNEVLKREDGKLAIEEIEEMPFAAMTPVIQTHRFYGRSIPDLVQDIQKIKTALLRAVLDSAYLANNQRLEIAESHATPETIDDILNNRPGGIVRTKQPGGLVPIPNQDIGPHVFPIMEYMDATREWRTGVTRQGQGIDAKSLADQSATAAAQMFTMAQARMRLIARIFAETGIRDMFLLLHAIIRRNDRRQNTVRLRNQWVQVDPQAWQRRKDMTVHVGVGSGGKEQQMAFLLQLLGIQREAIATGSGLATTENVYNTLRKVVELGGLKSVEPYFADPAESPPQPPPPDPKVVAAEKKAEADKEAAMMEANLEMEKMQREFALREEQMRAEFALKQAQIAAEIDLKRQLGVMNAGAKLAATSSQVRLGGEPG